ncbi:uncharacterized protein LOC123917584 [Trifolium pratense]|uniref:uncharacterized protein LOC123917584 n=1 Tax=Trifolium pratense TaxID=57577 RepID=UPI001E693A06|nr:uncharacterized protein LOC123917584 [Trifolium pratense]
MSLSLIQGYSSAEEEEEDQQKPHIHDSDTDDLDDVNDNAVEPSAASHPSLGDRSIFDHHPPPPSASGLPSAFDAFSEIPGPPQFLNNSVGEFNPAKDADERGSRRHRKEKKDLPTGAVVEAKAQLVGIHERVRSDINGGQPQTPASLINSEPSKRVPTATNPNAEDAAELFRMCLQCGIPKTYSSARGMVCPVCGDRPPQDPNAESKKKGSTIKDKEKSKRMRGQSSHASWKSETEMQLRQHFD